jgi:SAM-dependent methyltransferase
MSQTSHTPEAFDAFERAGWNDGRAAPYHDGLGAITSQAIPALLDAAGVAPGKLVLDVATGPGYAAALAAERGAKAVAVDFSADMLTLAARLHPAVEFRQADASALPFEDATFDAVISNLLMPHVSDLPAVVSELVRVTRPGGRVALTTWDPEPPTYLSAIMEAVAAAGAVPPPDLPQGPSIFQYAADDELTALLAGAGLDAPAVEGVRFIHRIDDVDAFIADLTAGALRLGVLIAAQPPEVQVRIRSGFEERVQRWRSGAGYELPCALKLGSGMRP